MSRSRSSKVSVLFSSRSRENLGKVLVSVSSRTENQVYRSRVPVLVYIPDGKARTPYNGLVGEFLTRTRQLFHSLANYSPSIPFPRQLLGNGNNLVTKLTCRPTRQVFRSLASF